MIGAIIWLGQVCLQQRVTAIVVFCVTCILADALGQTTPQPVALSEQNMVELLVEKSPRLQSLKFDVQRAQERVDQSRAAYLPTIDIVSTLSRQRTPRTATISSLSPERTSQFSGLELRQSIYEGGRLGRTRDVADLNVERAEVSLFEAQQNALAELLQAAYRFASTGQQKEILTDSKKFQEKYLQITRSRFQRGGARNYELSQAEADMASFESRLQVTDRDLMQAKELLTTILQMPEISMEQLQVKLKPPRFEKLPSLDKLIEKAMLERPEIKLAVVDKKLARANKWLDLSSDLPALTLSGQYGYQTIDGSNFVASNSEVYSASINLRIPLFSGLSSLSKYRAGELAVASSEKTIEERQRVVRQEITQEFESVSTAESILTSSAKWKEQAGKALQQALESYRVGTVNSTQVLQIQNSKERAALAYTQALTDYYASFVRLRRAQGFDLRKIAYER